MTRPVFAPLLVAMCLVWGNGFAAAPPPPPSAPVKLGPAVYDIYEPSARLAGRRQGCMGDETPLGPNCVKNCYPEYRMEISGRQAKCISLKPLPPGTAPRPVTKQVVAAPPPLVPRAHPPAPGN